MIVCQAPWMNALETQLSTLHLCEVLMKSDRRSGLASSWAIDTRLLLDAAPFAWSAEVTQAVIEAGRSIPLDTQMNRWNLNSPTAWWHFERPLPYETLPRPCGISALAFGWIPTKQPDFGMPCVAWVASPREIGDRFPLSPSQTFEWGSGDTLGEMLEATRAEHVKQYGPGGRWQHKEIVGLDAFMAAAEGMARFVLSGLAWIEQRVAVVSEEKIERHRRKAFAKATGQQAPTVRVVHLRRAELGPAREAADDEESDHAFTCRWVVGGHWRNQACGAKQGDRRLTWIHPHLKGPDDKPLRTPAKTVFAVER